MSKVPLKPDKKYYYDKRSQAKIKAYDPLLFSKLLKLFKGMWITEQDIKTEQTKEGIHSN
jgi:hypothetical protein